MKKRTFSLFARFSNLSPILKIAVFNLLTFSFCIPIIYYYFSGKAESIPMLGKIPPYRLLDQNDKSYGSKDLQGHPYVTTFFFTSCKTVCPLIVQSTKALQQEAKVRNVKVRLVSITVDPETDTPDRLATFIKSNEINTENWHFLTGNRNEIQALAEGGFFVSMGEKQEIPGQLIDIAHTARFIVIDKEGVMRGLFESTAEGRAEVLNILDRLTH